MPSHEHNRFCRTSSVSRRLKAPIHGSSAASSLRGARSARTTSASAHVTSRSPRSLRHSCSHCSCDRIAAFPPPKPSFIHVKTRR
eukprot:scaffold11673_cov100-Isochrysis_galbana.AAC.5